MFLLLKTLYKNKMNSLRETIFCDIQSEIYKYYDKEDIEYNCKEEPEESIINFFSYLYRLIPVIKRKVHYSQELKAKINSKEVSSEHIDILKKFEDAFCEGKDMNGFLSNKIKKSNDTDFLLFTWHIYHLHMSSKFVDRKQMKNNRSDTQLLCIINEKDVYFIDLILHPQKPEEYFNINYLKILVNNGWMEKIGFCENKGIVPGSLEPNIEDNTDIFLLCSKASVNLPFEFEGKVYFPIQPMMSNRRTNDISDLIIKIRKKINELEVIESQYLGFHFVFDSEGHLLGLVKLRTKTGSEYVYNIIS